jgi:hypothetical protein
MSCVSIADSTPTPSGRRLEHLQRTLQRLVKRKLNGFELAARDRAALLLLRSEQAASDPTASLQDVVRCENVARRAVADYQRIATAKHRQPKRPTTIREALGRE